MIFSFISRFIIFSIEMQIFKWNLNCSGLILRVRPLTIIMVSLHLCLYNQLVDNLSGVGCAQCAVALGEK